MLLMLLGDGEPGGQVFSIAAEKDQASIVFNKASVMVAYSPKLAELLEPLKTSIYCPQLNASIRPLSGKPQGKHGLNMSGLVGDEIHEWKTGDLYTFVHDSAAARRQPLEILISTAGVKGTHGEEVWDECQAILAGDIEAPDTLVIAYAANDNDDWTDPEVHRLGSEAEPGDGVEHDEGERDHVDRDDHRRARPVEEVRVRRVPPVDRPHEQQQEQHVPGHEERAQLPHHEHEVGAFAQPPPGGHRLPQREVPAHRIARGRRNALTVCWAALSL